MKIIYSRNRKIKKHEIIGEIIKGEINMVFDCDVTICKRVSMSVASKVNEMMIRNSHH